MVNQAGRAFHHHGSNGIICWSAKSRGTLIGMINGQAPPTRGCEVICRGVGGFNVRYFDGVHWAMPGIQRKPIQFELPAAVEVTLTLDRPKAAPPTRTARVVQVRADHPWLVRSPYDTTVSTGSPMISRARKTSRNRRRGAIFVMALALTVISARCC